MELEGKAKRIRKSREKPTMIDDSKPSDKFQDILTNIQARSSIETMQSTLEGTDGCKGHCFEYLDHTADVQLHAWGMSLERAFENITVCFFNYITDLTTITIDPAITDNIVAAGHDRESLLYAYLDELLFRFSVEQMVYREAEIRISESKDSDLCGPCTSGRHNSLGSFEPEFCCNLCRPQEKSFQLTALMRGEKFDRTKHPQGTEVKAITYSNMQIIETEEKCDLYVIIDIDYSYQIWFVSFRLLSF